MTARTLSRLAWVLLVVGSLAVSGCNTMSGMGRDISTAGDSMECCAEKSK